MIVTINNIILGNNCKNYIITMLIDIKIKYWLNLKRALVRIFYWIGTREREW